MRRASHESVPVVRAAVATYATDVEHSGFAYTSGHGPVRPESSYVIGKLGATLDLAAGREAARLTGLNIIATLRDRLGTL